MLYWLLALPARFGGPSALALTMTAFNTAAIIASVAIARRMGGKALMFAAAAAIALMSGSFGTEALYGIWNPAAGLFALVLLSFTCWALACGERWLLPLAVLVASFAAQAHLAYVAPALGLLAVGVVGLVISRLVPDRRAAERGGRALKGGGALWLPERAARRRVQKLARKPERDRLGRRRSRKDGGRERRLACPHPGGGSAAALVESARTRGLRPHRTPGRGRQRRRLRRHASERPLG
jgi:preprotein translocase subunit Sss1